MGTRASVIRAEARSPEFRASGRQSASEMLEGAWGPGCRIIGLTMGQFSLLDLIRAVLDRTGPAHLVLSTWTAGIRDAENAAWLLDSGALLSVRMLVDRSFPTRQPEYCRSLVALFGPECLRETNTHAKFALLRNDGWNVAIRSSMNLNRNPRFEQFDLDDNASICALFDGLMAEMEQLMPEGVGSDCELVDRQFGLALDGRDMEAGQRERRQRDDPRLAKWARLVAD